MALSQIYNAIAGDTITAARWNNEFGNLYGNGTDLAFPLTKAVTFAGYTITFDVAGVSTITSPANTGFLFTIGAKAGAPSASGSLCSFTASTFTDTSTAVSGTAALWTGVSIRTPTLAAAAVGVTTTKAATLYLEAAPVQGANETLTNSYALYVDSGKAQFDGNVEVDGTLQCGSTLIGPGFPVVNEFRLTLTTGLPVTTADVTAAGTLYLTPYSGTHISLYDGTLWNTYSTAQISLVLALTTGKPYDIFCYSNAGVPTLEVLVWTDDTNRATALAYQDGVLVKSGATTRRYLGTLYASGANTTEDSFAKRYLWNYYNRASRPMRVFESTASWQYTTATYRQARASASNQLDFVLGVSEDAVEATLVGSASNTSPGTTVALAIGLDSTSVASTHATRGVATTPIASYIVHGVSVYRDLIAAGRHKLVWLEYSEAAGTTSFYGDNGGTVQQGGIAGFVRG